MVLPPYVYKGDWREMKAHVAAVFAATPLPCMLYNNPIAYGTDFLPEQIRELAAEHENLEAVKESSTDVRRVSAIRALLDDRLEICVGVDDAVIEAIGVGATGWIAGLANALPRESVDLFNCGMNGESEKAFELYRWFLPLLRMDTVPNFVQLIKLVQAEVGIGNARVRPPRLELAGKELEQTKKLISDALQSKPQSAVRTRYRMGNEMQTSFETKIAGRSLIGFREGSGAGEGSYATNPTTGERLQPGFIPATAEEIELAVHLAAEAFEVYQRVSGRERGAFLRKIAANIESIAAEIIERAAQETALPQARLQAETARTCAQLRLFAQVAEEGSWVQARIDHADPDRKPAPKPDIRSMLRPLGPVVVFGASNFPLAFSVAGGDTASALRGGNP